MFGCQLDGSLANWTLADEVRRLEKSSSVPEHVQRVPAKDGRVLFVTKQYLEAVSESTHALRTTQHPSFV